MLLVVGALAAQPVIEVSAEPWDPLSRGILQSLAPWSDVYEVVAVTTEPATAWSWVLADPRFAHVHLREDPAEEAPGRLGEVTVRVDGRAVAHRLGRVGDPVLAAALDAGRTDPAGIAWPQVAGPEAIREAADHGRMRDLRRLAGDVPAQVDPSWRDALNDAAWVLLTTGHGSKDDQLADALTERLWATGWRDPGFLDTRALASSRNGRAEEALALQTEAVARLPDEPELRERLERYAAEAGAPPPVAPFEGTIADAWAVVGHGGVFVGPPGTETLSMVGVRPLRSDAVGDLDRTTPMALHGSPADHPLLAEVLAFHGIGVEEGRISMGGVSFDVPAHAILVAALPSPWAPSVPVVVYAGVDPGTVVELNRVRLGNDQATIAVLGPEPAALFSTDLVFEDGRLVGTGLGQASLSREEALEDLDTLLEDLRATYSGLPDLDLAIGGWEAHAAAVRERVAASERWSWDDFAALVVDDLLGPVQDTHFRTSGAAVVDGAIHEVEHRHVRDLPAWFTELRARSEGGDADRRFVAVGGDLDGEPVPAVLVPGPADVRPGVLYAFPTRDARGAEQYLVGVFAPSAPEPVEILGRDWPLHTGRSTLTEPWKDPWSYTTDGPIPVVTLRRMWGEGLQGFARGVAPAARQRRLVLDERGNGGGSDEYAFAFVRHFWGGPYRTPGGADLSSGWWASERPGTMRLGNARPWRGDALYVLVDHGVASSGESMVAYAGQLPRVTFVGVSTAGCTRNGNVEEHGPLPHSRLTFHWGHTRFVDEVLRPIVEGVGTFPDVWLDEPDPVSFVAGWPAGPDRGAGSSAHATR